MSQHGMVEPDTHPSPSQRRQRWGTVGRSMTIFGLFWLVCLLALGMASAWVGQLMSEPPPSNQSVALTVIAMVGFLLVAAVLPWVGIATAIWARRAGAGVDSLVALGLNALTASLVLVVLGLSLTMWVSS